MERGEGGRVTAAGLFWGATATVAYTYVGFPSLVMARAVLRARPVASAPITPAVSIIIAARNEEADIGRKLDNLLELDYPAERLEVVVASDGSEDGTNAIVESYAGRAVRLLDLPRVGKAGALNAAISAATHEVLVFTDANSMLDSRSLRALVAPLADLTVGGVAGDQRYVDDGNADGLAAGEQRYWGFDRLLKAAESRAGSVISATGALYALRSDLATAIPDGVTDDFYESTGVIAQGHRLVFAPEAVAYEPVASSGELEFGRKVRIMTRGLRGVAARRELLDPRQHGFYAVQLLSHKVLRRLMAAPLLVLAAAAPALAPRHVLYRLATGTQLAFYSAGAAGLLLNGKQPLKLPAYFCLVNAASVNALWNLARGRRIDRWEPHRSVAGARSVMRGATR
jgi:hypothetical protein